MADSRELYSVGRDVGFSPTVDVYDAATGELVNRFLAFEASFGGGVRVATGDVNGDGFTDVVCATAAGTTGRVRVFSGADGSMLANRVAFGHGYTGGISVAVGDLDGDGLAEIVAGRLSGRSAVRVYRGGDFSLATAFLAFPRMAGGVSVTAATVATAGPVIAAASGTAPVVRLFDAEGTLFSAIRPYGAARFGLTLAAADLTGDGLDELAIAPAAGGNRVRIVDPSTSARLATFTAAAVADPHFGIRLGTLDSLPGSDRLLVGNGPGTALAIRVYDDLSGDHALLPPSSRRRAYGIFVG
jgi:hypothetical protein